MKISDIKKYVLDPKKSILDVEMLRQFFLNAQSTRSRKRLDASTAKARRVEKYGAQRFGEGWWK